jgi:hypothetical protein
MATTYILYDKRFKNPSFFRNYFYFFKKKQCFQAFFDKLNPHYHLGDRFTMYKIKIY